MDRQNHKPAAAQRQVGAALMVSLMILLVLTLVGIASMSTTILEEKMAGGVRNQNLAFQAAEAALRAGETWIKAQQNPMPKDVATCNSPPCQVMTLGSSGDLATHDSTWWNLNAREYGAEGTREIGEVSTDPRFVVEKRAAADRTGTLARGISTPGPKNLYYRLTARGTGGNASAEVILQSHYMIIN